MKIINSEGKIKPLCDCCLRQFATMYDYDPYATEIKGDYTKIFMCEECYQNACEEI